MPVAAGRSRTPARQGVARGGEPSHRGSERRRGNRRRRPADRAPFDHASAAELPLRRRPCAAAPCSPCPLPCARPPPSAQPTALRGQRGRAPRRPPGHRPGPGAALGGGRCRRAIGRPADPQIRHLAAPAAARPGRRRGGADRLRPRQPRMAGQDVLGRRVEEAWPSTPTTPGRRSGSPPAPRAAWMATSAWPMPWPAPADRGGDPGAPHRLGRGAGRPGGRGRLPHPQRAPSLTAGRACPPLRPAGAGARGRRRGAGDALPRPGAAGQRSPPRARLCRRPAGCRCRRHGRRRARAMPG